jgi:hypothetical protein
MEKWVEELFLSHLNHDYHDDFCYDPEKGWILRWTELDREMAEYNYREIIRCLGSDFAAVYKDACEKGYFNDARLFTDVEDYIAYKEENPDEV